MSLPIKKVYIDSRFKTKDSQSNSNFKFELKQSIQLPENCVCYIDDIIIPHTWYTIENFNNKLYIREYDTTGSPATTIDKTLIIPSQNYSGSLLAAAIKTSLDLHFTTSVYTVSYLERKGTITISTTTTNKTFIILSDDQLKDQLGNTWLGTVYDTANPQDMNDVLRHTFMTASASYESGFIDLKNIHNIYISSPNVGSFSTLGPRGENNIIKKVPVSSDYGYSIFDSVVMPHDYIDVSKQLLSILEFSLKSARGDVIPLHGSHVSFSLIFSMVKQDI